MVAPTGSWPDAGRRAVAVVTGLEVTAADEHRLARPLAARGPARPARRSTRSSPTASPAPRSPRSWRGGRRRRHARGRVVEPVRDLDLAPDSTDPHRREPRPRRYRRHDLDRRRGRPRQRRPDARADRRSGLPARLQRPGHRPRRAASRPAHRRRQRQRRRHLLHPRTRRSDTHATHFDRIFGTPHNADLAALCAASQHAAPLVATADELRDRPDPHRRRPGRHRGPIYPAPPTAPWQRSCWTRRSSSCNRDLPAVQAAWCGGGLSSGTAIREDQGGGDEDGDRRRRAARS